MDKLEFLQNPAGVDRRCCESLMSADGNSWHVGVEKHDRRVVGVRVGCVQRHRMGIQPECYFVYIINYPLMILGHNSFQILRRRGELGSSANLSPTLLHPHPALRHKDSASSSSESLTTRQRASQELAARIAFGPGHFLGGVHPLLHTSGKPNAVRLQGVAQSRTTLLLLTVGTFRCRTSRG